MSLSQQKFREIVFQLLFSTDLSQADDEDMISFIMQQIEVPKSIVRQAIEQKKLLLTKQLEIDAMIKEASQEYQFERISRIERNILRLSVYEIFFTDTIPPQVSIAEAIRLARKFATPEGANFVNAILDGLYKKKG